MTREHIPFLDGARAVAVLAVMAYHSGAPGLRRGGYLGVDVFFVLSGLLITSLLLDECGERGTIRLLRFWAHRARRLFPGLIVMLLFVDLYVARLAPAGEYPRFRADATSVLGYFSNWHFVSAGSDYFASTASPSLLTHTWSLAIEEQFYLVWPLFLLLLVRWRRRDPARTANAVLAFSVIGALASAGWMAFRYRSGASASVLYYGTDTHAQCLLVGAALAGGMQRFGRGRSRSRRHRPRAFARRAPRSGLVTLVLAAGAACFFARVGSDTGFVYEGGFLFFACLVAGLLLAMIDAPAGRAARLLSARPLVYLGTISYGMYLWYFPLFAIVTRSRTGLTGTALFIVRLVAVVAAASASFYLVERPVRTGGLRRVAPGRHVSPLRPAVMSVSGMVVTLGVVTVTGSGLVSEATPNASASPAMLTAMAHPGLRLLVTGDSTALTLGLALEATAAVRPTAMVVANDATLGCGVAMSSQVREHGQTTNAPAPCNTSTTRSRQWPAELRTAVRVFRPDVVLLAAGRTEVLDRRSSPGEPWENIIQSADARYVLRRLDAAIGIADNEGASVLVSTAPCFSSGEQPSGAPWPEDDPERLSAYNRLARAAVAASAGHAALLDLGAMVCPSGTYHQSIGGITVRAPDGVHYPFYAVFDPDAEAPDTLAQTEAFGRWIMRRIMPALSSGSSPDPPGSNQKTELLQAKKPSVAIERGG